MVFKEMQKKKKNSKEVIISTSVTHYRHILSLLHDKSVGEVLDIKFSNGITFGVYTTRKHSGLVLHYLITIQKLKVPIPAN